MDSKEAQRETARSRMAGSWGSWSGGCIQQTTEGAMQNGKRGRSWNVQVSAVRAVWIRAKAQREDPGSVSGVGRARVMVMGVSRGLMEERWKQWRQGKEDGKEVVEPAVFCGQCLD